ncbi:hypothetical protein HMPREF0026_00783 [Acinetobacter junii SH205]|uniref:DUF4124 domain-containing protein n=2 Tax=Acinetobacter junii TaxID=40215 RepID=A0ABU8ZIZ4_ACIJU|nr:DUF4124 domain-containing protein [Acinetobacter junii]EEY93507.1 hypothetical protein HMPREF0026_00783 [Acinetobacter junii SH205]
MKCVTFSQLLAIVSIGLMSSSFQLNAKEYYKWVDAKGVTTYSATPPPTKKQEPQLDTSKQNMMVGNTANHAVPTQVQAQLVKETKTAAVATTPQTKNVALAAKTDVLIPIKNCNGVRCWDTKGKAYNLVQGNTYLSSTGGKCLKTSNNMSCTK